jgi:regulator of ribonuclease activity A
MSPQACPVFPRYDGFIEKFVELFSASELIARRRSIDNYPITGRGQFSPNRSNPRMNFLTADLVDAHGDLLQSCEIQFRQFGGRRNFHGPVRTIQTREDNALIKRLLTGPGNGAVLVVDGGGSLRTALMGDMIAGAALKNGWAGVVIWGAVRDVTALGELELGIKALGSNPRKSAKAGTGLGDVPVSFGGATFTPGSWVYSDEDGLVVSAEQIR